MKRREFITGTGGAAAAALAGCSGSEEGDPTETNGSADQALENNETNLDEVNEELNSTKNRSSTESENQKEDYERELLASGTQGGDPHFKIRIEHDNTQYTLNATLPEDYEEEGEKQIPDYDCTIDVLLKLNGGEESVEETMSGPEWYSEVSTDDLMFTVERESCDPEETPMSEYDVKAYALDS